METTIHAVIIMNYVVMHFLDKSYKHSACTLIFTYASLSQYSWSHKTQIWEFDISNDNYKIELGEVLLKLHPFINCTTKYSAPYIETVNVTSRYRKDYNWVRCCWDYHIDTWLKNYLVHRNLCMIEHITSNAHTHRKIVPTRWRPWEKGQLLLNSAHY